MLENACKNWSEVMEGRFGIAIPWDQILQMIMSLMQNCFKNKASFAQVAKNPTFLQKAAMWVQLRRDLEELGVRRPGVAASALREQVLAQAASCEMSTLESCFGECQAAMTAHGGDCC